LHSARLEPVNKASCLFMEEGVLRTRAQRSAWSCETADVVVGGEASVVRSAIGRRSVRGSRRHGEVCEEKQIWPRRLVSAVAIVLVFWANAAWGAIGWAVVRKKVDLHQTRRDGSAETKPQASRNWIMADGGEQTVVKVKSSVNRVQCSAVQCSVVRYMTEQEQARAIRSVNSSCLLDVVELKVQQVRSPELGVGAAPGC